MSENARIKVTMVLEVLDGEPVDDATTEAVEDYVRGVMFDYDACKLTKVRVEELA